MKTFTCLKCGKIGQSFSEMAKEICSSDLGHGHTIPILGDRLKEVKN